jgi:large subunit ribosomal protein L7/L12
LHRIVDDISTLTLLQASDLVTLLKVKAKNLSYTCHVPQNKITIKFQLTQSRLNIQEIALPAAGAAAPAGAAAGGAGVDDAAAGEDAAAAAKPKEKTIFNVKLESFDAGSKPKVIKEVKAMVPNLTLIEVRVFARPDTALLWPF